MAVSLVQAQALEQRRALRRATGPSSIKGSLCKSVSSPRSNSPTLPRLPGEVEPPSPSPRAQAHVRSTSLPPVWGQSSPHSPRAERIRGPRNPAAPRVSDGTGVGSGGGAFCHFPALAPARPAEAAGGAHARSSVDEGQAADVYVDAAASDAGDARDAKGHWAEVAAWQPAPPSLSPRGASMGRLRGGRGRGRVEEVEETPEAPDPAIETMIEDFGRLVKRFEREHGLEEDEELEALLSPVDRLELERDTLLGELALETADMKHTADEKLQADQKAKVVETRLDERYQVLATEWVSYLGTDNRRLASYFRRLEKRFDTVFKGQCGQLVSHYDMMASTARFDTANERAGDMQRRLETDLSEEAIEEARREAEEEQERIAREELAEELERQARAELQPVTGVEGTSCFAKPELE